MHHTDYSSNLRKVQHKTHKTLSLKQFTKTHRGTEEFELLRAAIAIILVILTLLQMDPANARSSVVEPGYGHLVTSHDDQSVNVISFSQQMKMLMSDQQSEFEHRSVP